MDNANETQQLSATTATNQSAKDVSTASANPKTKEVDVDLGAALTNPKADAEELNQLEQNLFVTRYCSAEIAGFGMSIDPQGAAQTRSKVLSLLENRRHDLLCSQKTADLLARLSCPSAVLTQTQKAQVAILQHDRQKLVGVPRELAQKFAELTCIADDAWHKAKAQNSWEMFAPYLKQIIETMKEIAQARDSKKDPYDVWLDEYEQGTTHAFLDTFFEEVKSGIAPLLHDVLIKQNKGFRPNTSLFAGKFDIMRQRLLAHDIIDLMGLDKNHVVIVDTEHPYSDAPSIDYGIIASHLHEHDVLSNVFSMFHEGGHTLYETGVNPAYDCTSLKGGASYGIHESQSRFFENYIARDRNFAPHILRLMAHHFQGQLGRVTPQQFWQVSNAVKPGLIRMDADELTYPFHIMIRYEIEKQLFAGELDVEDVAATWNKLYKEYLGVEVSDPAHGALQDMHWSSGYLGYFPGYAVGDAIGAQLKHAMIASGIAWDDVLASGDLAPIRLWLKDHIWSYGRSRTPHELIEQASGEALTTTYYLDYLTQKFTALYNL